jgi:hypothetical protein
MYIGLWPGQWPGDWQGRANGDGIAAQLVAVETPDVAAFRIGEEVPPRVIKPIPRGRRSIRRVLLPREIALETTEQPDVAVFAVTLGRVTRLDDELAMLFRNAA